MAVATEAATTTVGGDGDITMVVAEGSLTKRPGGTPRRCLGGGCTMTVIVATMTAELTVTAAATMTVTAADDDVDNIDEDNNKDDNIDDNKGEDDRQPGDDGRRRGE